MCWLYVSVKWVLSAPVVRLSPTVRITCCSLTGMWVSGCAVPELMVSRRWQYRFHAWAAVGSASGWVCCQCSHTVPGVGRNRSVLFSLTKVSSISLCGQSCMRKSQAL